MRLKRSLAAAILATLSMPAAAYVGPGLGLGTILVLFCILVSILLAVAGIFWYPLKRALRRRGIGGAGAEESHRDP